MAIDNSVLYDVMKSQYDNLHTQLIAYQNGDDPMSITNLVSKFQECRKMQESFGEIINELSYDAEIDDPCAYDFNKYDPRDDDYDFGFGMLMDELYDLGSMFRDLAMEC